MRMEDIHFSDEQIAHIRRQVQLAYALHVGREAMLNARKDARDFILSNHGYVDWHGTCNEAGFVEHTVPGGSVLIPEFLCEHYEPPLLRLYPIKVGHYYLKCEKDAVAAVAICISSGIDWKLLAPEYAQRWLSHVYAALNDTLILGNPIPVALSNWVKSIRLDLKRIGRIRENLVKPEEAKDHSVASAEGQESHCCQAISETISKLGATATFVYDGIVGANACRDSNPSRGLDGLCGACKFYESGESTCRRWPPDRIGRDQNGGENTTFPIVSETHWCGEYATRETP